MVSIITYVQFYVNTETLLISQDNYDYQEWNKFNK